MRVELADKEKRKRKGEREQPHALEDKEDREKRKKRKEGKEGRPRHQSVASFCWPITCRHAETADCGFLVELLLVACTIRRTLLVNT